ncbi:MAG: hypothetical protein H6550_07500 [Chitinophagales bacterium]|nr:hypothetical protein [Chitinophagales bacterium]
MNKIKPGDVFEINTARGRAYLHYIYMDENLGELIRILPGLYSDMPENIQEIVQMPERYVLYFPLNLAYKKKIVSLVGSHPVSGYSKPEYMRSKHLVRNEFLGWHIINTDTWMRKLVPKLSSKQRKLSPWGIWSIPLLIENLEKDWSLEEWI